MDEGRLSADLDATNAAAELGMHQHHTGHTEPVAERLSQELTVLHLDAGERLLWTLDELNAPYQAQGSNRLW